MTALQWVIYVGLVGTGALGIVATAKAKRSRLQRSAEWRAAGNLTGGITSAAKRPLGRLNWAATAPGPPN